MKQPFALLVCSVLGFSPHSYGQSIRDLYTNEKINGKAIAIVRIECRKQATGAVDSTMSSIQYNAKGEAQSVYKRYDNRFPKPAEAAATVDVPAGSLKYQYDAAGNKVSATYATGMIHGIFKFSKKGEPIEWDEYENDRQIKEVRKTFDDNGNMLTMNVRANNAFVWGQVCKYNSDNLMLEEDDTHADNSTNVYYFKYPAFDAKGNWIQCLRLNTAKQVLNVSLRQIKYAD